MGDQSASVHALNFELLSELKAREKTVIVVSHDDRYYHLADRIIKVENGLVEYDKVVDADLIELTPHFLRKFIPSTKLRTSTNKEKPWKQKKGKTPPSIK